MVLIWLIWTIHCCKNDNDGERKRWNDDDDTMFNPTQNMHAHTHSKDNIPNSHPVQWCDDENKIRVKPIYM